MITRSVVGCGLLLACGGSVKEESSPAPTTQFSAAGGSRSSAEPSDSAASDAPGVSTRRDLENALQNEPPSRNTSISEVAEGDVAQSPSAACAGIDRFWDALHTEILEDVTERVPEASRSFTRYVAFSGQEDSPRCRPASEQGRYALSKLVNMLSTRESFAHVTEVSAEFGLYRFDLRALDWDVPLLVGERRFVDSWEAMVASNPYALSFEGAQATALQEALGTQVPWVGGSGLARTLTQGELYYALLGVDISLEAPEVLEQPPISLDEWSNRDRLAFIRAAESRDGYTQVLERQERTERPGHVWMDWWETRANSDPVYDKPLGEPEGPRIVAYTLPNGLYGFIFADGNLEVFPQRISRRGQTLGELSVPGLLAQYGGNLPVVEDDLRDYVKRNAFNFWPEDLEYVSQIYLPSEQFAQVQAQDEAAYRQVLERLGIPPAVEAPLVHLIESFEQALGAERMAAELGMSVDALMAQGEKMPPAVAEALSGSILREDFSTQYLTVACALHSQAANVPKGCD